MDNVYKPENEQEFNALIKHLKANGYRWPYPIGRTYYVPDAQIQATNSEITYTYSRRAIPVKQYFLKLYAESRG